MALYYTPNIIDAYRSINSIFTIQVYFLKHKFKSLTRAVSTYNILL